MKKVDEDVDKISVNRLGSAFSLPMGINLDRVVDVERNEPITNGDRACGTRAICGPSVARPEPQSG
jgi:hypothetical protein